MVNEKRHFMGIDYPKAIIDLRVQMNISQEGLADYLGVSIISVSRWENGHTTPTKLAKAKLEKLFFDYKINIGVIEK